MRITTVEKLARAVGGQVWLPEGAGRRAASGEVGPRVVIDARRAEPGSLFVALPGERVDGHDFTGQAEANGAAAVLVTRPTAAKLPHVVVTDGAGDPAGDDSLVGLTRLAADVVATERSRGMVAAALTGSSGKTSTKDMLAQVLEASGPTVAPVGSFNNEIGVPLTACGCDETTRYLVSEMGARGAGHIDRLTRTVPPDVAMVLNIGTAHLGEFGSRDAIAAAKSEIVAALRPDGWAVLNAADPRVAAMTGRTGARLAWFSPDADHPHPEADIEVWASDVRSDALERHGFTLHTRIGEDRQDHVVRLRTVGAHQVANAVAAAAAALCCQERASRTDPDPAAVAEALGAATSRSPWRMEVHERGDGLVVVNDSYNANPDSMAAAVTTVARMAARRRTEDPSTRAVAVLGDMLELGPDAPSLHREVGARAARSGFDLVVGVGDLGTQIAAGARAAGVEALAVTPDQAASAVAWDGHDIVLVKASRGLALDRVAAALVEEDAR